MNHLEAFLNAMQADAALIHRPENLRWLANYTGEGCLFICRDAQVILTDSRYTEQARREAPEWGLEQVDAQLFRRLGVNISSEPRYEAAEKMYHK